MKSAPLRFPLAACLALLVAAGCSSTRDPNTPVFDNLIVPGQRIGPVSLGMPAKGLVQAAGSPKETRRLPNRTVSEFADGLVAVTRDSDLRVISIGTRDPWYATADGIRAGSSELEVRTHLGATPQVVEDRRNPRIRTYCYPGLEVDFWPQERGVAAVRVTTLACTQQF